MFSDILVGRLDFANFTFNAKTLTVDVTVIMTYCLSHVVAPRDDGFQVIKYTMGRYQQYVAWQRICLSFHY